MTYRGIGKNRQQSFLYFPCLNDANNRCQRRDNPCQESKNGFHRLVAVETPAKSRVSTDRSWLYRQSWLNNWPIGELKSAKIDSKQAQALFKVIGYIHDSNSLLIK